MKRPTARYELIANDIETFMTNGAKAGSKYTMTVRYLGFYDTGFHTLDGINKHGLQYVTYKRTITVPQKGTQEMSIAFDHIFVPENGEVPIAVELSNDKNALLARTCDPAMQDRRPHREAFQLPYRRPVRRYRCRSRLRRNDR